MSILTLDSVIFECGLKKLWEKWKSTDQINSQTTIIIAFLFDTKSFGNEYPYWIFIGRHIRVHWIFWVLKSHLNHIIEQMKRLAYNFISISALFWAIICYHDVQCDRFYVRSLGICCFIFSTDLHKTIICMNFVHNINPMEGNIWIEIIIFDYRFRALDATTKLAISSLERIFGILTSIRHELDMNL